MKFNVIVDRSIAAHDKCTVLAVQIFEEDPFEKAYISVYHNFLELEAYEFLPGMKLRVECSFETAVLDGLSGTELVADYIANEAGEEILNRSACHFPF